MQVLELNTQDYVCKPNLKSHAEYHLCEKCVNLLFETGNRALNMYININVCYRMFKIL